MKLEDQAKSIRQKLSNLSQKQGVSYQYIATSFLLERLVARIVSDSNLYKSIIFKGGYVALRIYESSRYTIDLDALLSKPRLKETLKQVRKAAEKDIGDAVWFRFEKEIDLKTQGEYGGIRQVFRSGIGEIPHDIKRSQIIHFDLGTGDPVIPQPVKVNMSELVGEKELSWIIYTIETMIAEKIHALVDRGEGSPRSKDIFDLVHFLPKANISLLKKALKACFNYRGTKLPRDLAEFISRIDTTLLKRGWPSAVSGMKQLPVFEDNFKILLKELKKISMNDISNK